jgi:hypothetical protein
VIRVLTRVSVGIHTVRLVGKSARFASCKQLNMHATDVQHDLKFSKQPDGATETKYPTDTIVLMIANFSGVGTVLT